MSAPRLVVVHRRTWLAELLEVHSTLGAVEFFLSGRGLPMRRSEERSTPSRTRYRPSGVTRRPRGVSSPGSSSNPMTWGSWSGRTA